MSLFTLNNPLQSLLWPKEQRLIREVTLVLLGIVLLGLSAQAVIPIRPVPLTFQSAAVVFIGLLYGSRLGSLTVMGYLLAGSLGLPLFADLNVTECTAFSDNFKKSWIHKELYKVRNIRPAMRWGLPLGLAYAAMDTYLFRGHAPWTFANHADHLQLKPASECQKITYPKHDNKVTFDLMSSVFLTNSHHDENQPCHLILKNQAMAIEINYKKYASPETRYCPAGVYEIVFDENHQPRFHMNYANCIQCKACDIKDPTQNIIWTPPEGGCGPQYGVM